MRETWYVLEDGTAVDPAECSTMDDGTLAHQSGAKVAMRGNTHSSRGVDPEEERAKAPVRRDMKAEEPSRPYKTRESKAR